jgi:hypothetical protein
LDDQDTPLIAYAIQNLADSDAGTVRNMLVTWRH